MNNINSTYKFNQYHINDWVCSSCNTISYGQSNKIICICGQTKYGSKLFSKSGYTWRIGDKLCLNCNEYNFKNNQSCFKCKNNLLE